MRQRLMSNTKLVQSVEQVSVSQSAPLAGVCVCFLPAPSDPRVGGAHLGRRCCTISYMRR